MSGRVRKGLEDAWTTLNAATLIKSVNDKDKGLLGVAMKFTDEFKEESGSHGLWCYVCVVAKTFCNNASKRGEVYRKFADESREDISGLSQILVTPLAEKGSSELLFIVKARADRMC